MCCKNSSFIYICYAAGRIVILAVFRPFLNAGIKNLSTKGCLLNKEYVDKPVWNVDMK